jgi:hypothetical protein
MSAPERIWLDWPGANRGEPVFNEPPERDTQPGQTEYILKSASDAAINAAVQAERERVFSALCAGYELMHPSEDTQERVGRRNAIRGAMVRLGMYGGVMKGPDNGATVHDPDAEWNAAIEAAALLIERNAIASNGDIDPRPEGDRTGFGYARAISALKRGGGDE